MPRVCGIELASSEAVIAVIEDSNHGHQFIDIDSKKIKIGNDESVDQVQAFHDLFINFIRDNHIDIVAIKKRAKKGPYSGGAVSFKLEALIQLNGLADVIFVSGQGIAASNKKKPFEFPKNLNRYQEDAYMAAALYLRQTE